MPLPSNISQADFTKIKKSTLPKTNSLPFKNGWELGNDPFLLGFGLFSGVNICCISLLVSRNRNTWATWEFMPEAWPKEQVLVKTGGQPRSAMF